MTGGVDVVGERPLAFTAVRAATKRVWSVRVKWLFRKNFPETSSETPSAFSPASLVLRSSSGSLPQTSPPTDEVELTTVGMGTTTFVAIPPAASILAISMSVFWRIGLRL